MRVKLLAGAILLCVAPAVALGETSYVGEKAQVRFTSAPPPAKWMRPAFDDSAWTSGAMPLVNEARKAPSPEGATRLPAAPRVVYVRARFQVGDEAKTLRSLLLRARLRDGLIAWIDGVEVARRYIPAGAAPDAPADMLHGPEPEDLYIPVTRKIRLAPGEHVLALEVRARAVEGPEIDAQLSGFDEVRIVRGPYLIRPGASEITVVWETDVDAPGQVQYGMTTDYGQTVSSALAVRRHALRIRGLKPGTPYHYRVVAAGSDSGDATFRTLPKTGEPLRFVLYGDMRSGPVVHARIAAQVQRENPNLLVLAGDLVNRGNEEAEWQSLFSILGPLLRTVAVTPAIGNHDLAGAEGPARYLAVFPPPPGAPEPTYYSFDAAGVHFTMLDSNNYRSAQQLKWCESDLVRAKDARAKFVVTHHSPWANGPHGGHAEALARYVPIFRRYGVNMIFAGHDHIYERGQVEGMNYMVAGGGGSPLYNPRCGFTGMPCPPSTLAIAKEYHYLSVEVNDGSFRVCARRPDGSPLEPCLDYPLRRGK